MSVERFPMIVSIYVLCFAFFIILGPSYYRMGTRNYFGIFEFLSQQKYETTGPAAAT